MKYILMPELTPQDIQHLGRLARLELTSEEGGRFASQLSSVVGYIEQLSEVNTDSVAQITGVTGLSNVLAADQVRSANDLCAVRREDLLAGAPASQDGSIIVRAVLGDEVVGA